MKIHQVYLDGAANTPLDKSVLKIMKPYLSHKFVGNSMAIHDYGIKASDAITQARSDIASVLRVPVDSVYFSSGATESNNWAIKSVVMRELEQHTGRNHIICSAMEHDSVLKCCEDAQKVGMDVTFIKPSNHAYITLDDVMCHITDKTCLICVMDVNNELGTENEVASITKYAKEHNILTLVDCTQTVSYGSSYLELGARFPNATFFSFSAHKFYGPGGVGALIARGYTPYPMIIGGSQENGTRGGTSNTAGIIGMAAALQKMRDTMVQPYFVDLAIYLKSRLNDRVPGVFFNAWPTHMNIISLNCSKVLKYDQLASALGNNGIAVSAGSACDSEHNETLGDFNGSHVLQSIGLSENEMRNTIRVSFTKYTTKKDIDRLINALEDLQKCQAILQ